MIKTRALLILICLCAAPYVAFAENADQQPAPPQECLQSAETPDMLIECMESIYASVEAKRLVLENTATHKDFDPESTLDWPSLYKETLENSRRAFELYRTAECERKEILYNTGYKSKYDKLTCQIRMTKDRINALQ